MFNLFKWVFRGRVQQAAEKVHLLCWLQKLVTATYEKSTTRSSLPDLTGASHMELFEQPEQKKGFFFSILLGLFNI